MKILAVVILFICLKSVSVIGEPRHGEMPNTQEILTNGDFNETVPVEKPINKWRFPSGKLPKSWFPIYSHRGDAAAEAVPATANPANNKLRLKDGAIAQNVNVPPSPRERVLKISLDLNGRGTFGGKGSCQIRITGRNQSKFHFRNVSNIVNLTRNVRRYQGEIVIPPGVTITRIALWAYPSDIRVDNFTAKLEEPRGAAKPSTTETAIPDNTATTRLELNVGSTGMTFTLWFRDGSHREVVIYPFSLYLPLQKEGKEANTFSKALPDAGLAIVGLQGDLRLHVRPDVTLLQPETRKKYLSKWDSLPSPLEHALVLEFRRHSENFACYADGQYAGLIPSGGGLKKIVFSAPKGSMEEILNSPTTSDDETILSLAVDRQTAVDPAAAIALEPARLHDLAAKKLDTASGKSLDIGKTAQAKDRYRNHSCCYGSDYLSRSGFDGDDTSFLFTVPSEQYTRAWALCAFDGSPDKDPALTARVTRFVSGAWGGRARECLADTTVELPRESEKTGEGFTRVGTVELNGKTRPLWLVEIPLKSGEIQDVLFHEKGDRQRGPATGTGDYGNLVTFENGARQRGVLNFGPYLDFELTGRLIPRAHPFRDRRYLPDPERVSGVHVFAAALETTPMEMEIRQVQPGNIFHNDEKPEIIALLRPRKAGNYQLSWSIRDVDGVETANGQKEILARTPENKLKIPISLRQSQPGWYEVVFNLSEAGRNLLTHHAAFAQLGPDTRQAGYESPYGTWWYRNWHYGTDDPRIVGPLLFKAGLRRINPQGGGPSEADLAPWKVTSLAIGWLGGLLEQNAPDEKIVERVAKELKRFPHCRGIMIFHESIQESPYRNATELFGLPPIPESEKAPKRRAQALRLAKLVRKNFPNLKIVIGNSLASTELIAEQLRHGFPQNYGVYMGNETVGRTTLPERISEYGQSGAAWMLRETAKKFGYPWRVTNCFESNFRQTRLLGTDRQAEWYVRDMLLAHAYGLPDISLAKIYDVGNLYNGSFWGDVALCERYPLLYPKKCYVAVATLTKTLDRAKRVREVPTGSNSVYALEFLRPDDKLVYAIWTGRGTATLDLNFQTNTDYELIDMYGRSREEATVNDEAKLTIDTAPRYLVVSHPIAQISVVTRSYPNGRPTPDFKTIATMDDVEAWRLDLGEDPLLEMSSEPRLPFRTAGDFLLRSVKDPEKGTCLEVELKPNPNLPTPLMSEYAVLRLKNPIELPDKPDTLGIWVKGNSGWGQVFFETVDARGVRRISCGTTVHNIDVFDYDGRMSINFDGWNFLSLPITKESPIPELSTGSVENLWESSEKYLPDQQKPVTYPVKLTGIAFSLPPQAIRLTEMFPIKQVLRFKEIATRFPEQKE